MKCVHVYHEIENEADELGYKPFKKILCEKCGVEVWLNEGDEIVAPAILKESEIE